MGDNDKRQPNDEEAHLRRHEQEEVKRERSVRRRGCLIVLLVGGLLGLIIVLRILTQ